jgi:type IV secretory pathway component VirB8
MFLTISAFSTKKEVSLPNYLDKAKKWNEENIAQRLSEIRLAARIMPS